MMVNGCSMDQLLMFRRLSFTAATRVSTLSFNARPLDRDPAADQRARPSIRIPGHLHRAVGIAHRPIIELIPPDPARGDADDCGKPSPLRDQ